MKAKVFAVVVFFIINFKLCQGRNYTNYYLITIVPTKKEHMKYLHTLETQKYMDIMFWEKPARVRYAIQATVSPEDISTFRERADHFGLNYTIMMTDLQRAFRDQTLTTYQKLRPDTYSFEYFHGLEDVYQWLADLDQNISYPVTHLSLGKSIEGRHISMVNININPSQFKQKVIIEGGIHGHEWASVVYVTYLINQLSRAEQSNNFVFKKLARKFDWYLIPVANPDGYDYTHKSDRLWRKNRRHLGDQNYGVDLNRNFDQAFGRYYSSKEPSSDNYCGPSPFSEPESAALSFFVTTNHRDLKYYIAIHAYGQKIIIPYDDRVQHLENYGEMESYSRQAVRKIYLRSRIKYTTGTTFDTSGSRISGSSTSWAKKQMKVHYVYTLVLRDNGTYGYALPNEQLLPMCKETQTIMTELMTAKPRYVKALYDDDATIIISDKLLIILACFFGFGLGHRF